eukprot:599865-Prymnesium_polylepis.1
MFDSGARSLTLSRSGATTHRAQHPVTGNKTVMHWGEFLCATITSFVVGMPFVMLNCGAIELNAALLGLSGFILATTTLMCAVSPPFCDRLTLSSLSTHWPRAG